MTNPGRLAAAGVLLVALGLAAAAYGLSSRPEHKPQKLVFPERFKSDPTEFVVRPLPPGEGWMHVRPLLTARTVAKPPAQYVALNNAINWTTVIVANGEEYHPPIGGEYASIIVGTDSNGDPIEDGPYWCPGGYKAADYTGSCLVETGP